MRTMAIFDRYGFSYGMLNGMAGYVKLFPWGSIVVAASERLGYVAYSPAPVVRKRTGVFRRIGVCKPNSGKELAAFLKGLTAIERISDSWEWQNPSQDRTSSMNRRGGAPLHHRGLPHARNKSGRVVWANR